jgi:hypothetical protein
MKEKRKLWVAYHHFKLAGTILLYLPLLKLVIGEAPLADLRMIWVVSIVLISPYMRFYREVHSHSNQI